MILALRQAVNGNGADAPGSFEHDGKTSAVGRVVAQIQTGSRLQSAVGAFVFQPYGVGAAVVARNHVAFAANPFPIVRSGSGQGARKEREAGQLDGDDYGNFALFGSGT